MILGIERLLSSERPKVGGMPTFSTVAWLATGMAFATMPFIGRVPYWQSACGGCIRRGIAALPQGAAYAMSCR